MFEVDKKWEVDIFWRVLLESGGSSKSQKSSWVGPFKKPQTLKIPLDYQKRNQENDILILILESTAEILKWLRDIWKKKCDRNIEKVADLYH